LGYIHICSNGDCPCRGVTGYAGKHFGLKLFVPDDDNYHCPNNPCDDERKPMKRPDKPKEPSQMPGAFKDELFRKSFPSLHAFLFDTKWDDGTPRQVGSISIFTQLGVLKVCVNDKAMERVAFAEIHDWEELTATLDSIVCCDDTEWKVATRRPPF